MLDHRRRSQLRLEPIGAALPTTGTTTTRRTRRLCLNIETNGAVPLRSRRRRRSALPDPYLMTYPPVYGANPWICGDWGSNENFYSYGNYVNPLNRLYGGEEYEYAPVDDGFIPPEEESAQKPGQKAAGDLKNILMSLEGYLQEENNVGSENNGKPNQIEVSEDQEPQNHQLSVLTELICDTIGRLNNCMTAMSKNHGSAMDMQQLRPLPRVPPPVQVLQLPVQPLIIPPMPPGIYPPYVMEPEYCPTESKTHFERLPWLKERKRKRPSKSIVHVQSQSCSTDDLNTLPRILKASNSQDRKVRCPMKSSGLQEKPAKDLETPSSMAIRCPRKCCGLVPTQEPEKPSEVFKIPSPMTIGDHYPPSLLRAPPPSMRSEDEMDRDHEMDSYQPRTSNPPQKSSYSSSCDYQRQAGGNIIYSFVEEEDEEQLQVGTEEEHVDEDEWYQGASHQLAELELEQEFFKEMQKQCQVSTKDQEQQTDPEIDSLNRSMNIIVTTDKAVSTTELNELPEREPVKIVRIYKRSSLKSRHRLPSGNQRGKSRNYKVKFEKVQ
ncbi:hypothetical protein KR054_001890, partial [Drosophila jambulina]